MLFWERAIITQGEKRCGGECGDGDADCLVGGKFAHQGESNNETIGFSGGDDIRGTEEGKIGTLNMKGEEKLVR